MPYIISKLASGVDFNLYEKGKNNKYIRKGVITIHGGTGIADKRTLVTPDGVVTKVSDMELAALKKDVTFVRMERDGMLKITNSNPSNLEKAVSDMTKDKSAQLTPEDYTKAGKKPPRTKAE